MIIIVFGKLIRKKSVNEYPQKIRRREIVQVLGYVHNRLQNLKQNKTNIVVAKEEFNKTYNYCLVKFRNKAASYEVLGLKYVSTYKTITRYKTRTLKKYIYIKRKR